MATESFDPVSFTLRQLDGPKRAIVLNGRGLPFRGLELPTEQRVNVTMPLGGSVGTGSAQGGRFPPINIRGEWRQHHIAVAGADSTGEVDNGPLLSVRDLDAFMHRFVLEGQLTELVWDVHVRHVMLSRYTPRWLRTDWLEWELEMQVISMGLPPAPVLQLRVDPSSEVSWLDSLFGQIDAILDEAAALFEPVHQVLRDAAEIKDAMIAAIDQATNLILTPVELARNVIQLATQFVAAIKNAIPNLIQKLEAATLDIAAAAQRFGAAFSSWSVPGSHGAVSSPTSSPATEAGGAPANPYVKPSKAIPTKVPGSSITPPVQTLPRAFNVFSLEILGVIIPKASADPDEPRAAETVPPGDPRAAETVPGTESATQVGVTEDDVLVEPQTQAPGGEPGAGYGSQLDAALQRRRILRVVRALARDASSMLQRLRAQATDSAQLIGIWVASRNDDLRDVATHYYGAPGGWRDLAVFNRLDRSALASGTVVFVPRQGAR